MYCCAMLITLLTLWVGAAGGVSTTGAGVTTGSVASGVSDTVGVCVTGAGAGCVFTTGAGVTTGAT